MKNTVLIMSILSPLKETFEILFRNSVYIGRHLPEVPKSSPLSCDIGSENI